MKDRCTECGKPHDPDYRGTYCPECSRCMGTLLSGGTLTPEQRAGIAERWLAYNGPDLVALVKRVAATSAAVVAAPGPGPDALAAAITAHTEAQDALASKLRVLFDDRALALLTRTLVDMLVAPLDRTTSEHAHEALDAWD